MAGLYVVDAHLIHSLSLSHAPYWALCFRSASIMSTLFGFLTLALSFLPFVGVVQRKLHFIQYFRILFNIVLYFISRLTESVFVPCASICFCFRLYSTLLFHFLGVSIWIFRLTFCCFCCCCFRCCCRHCCCCSSVYLIETSHISYNVVNTHYASRIRLNRHVVCDKEIAFLCLSLVATWLFNIPLNSVFPNKSELCEWNAYQMEGSVQ